MRGGPSGWGQSSYPDTILLMPKSAILSIPSGALELNNKFSGCMLSFLLWYLYGQRSFNGSTWWHRRWLSYMTCISFFFTWLLFLRSWCVVLQLRTILLLPWIRVWVWCRIILRRLRRCWRCLGDLIWLAFVFHFWLWENCFRTIWLRRLVVCLCVWLFWLCSWLRLVMLLFTANYFI